MQRMPLLAACSNSLLLAKRQLMCWQLLSLSNYEPCLNDQGPLSSPGRTQVNICVALLGISSSIKMVTIPRPGSRWLGASLDMPKYSCHVHCVMSKGQVSKKECLRLYSSRLAEISAGLQDFPEENFGRRLTRACR